MRAVAIGVSCRPCRFASGVGVSDTVFSYREGGTFIRARKVNIAFVIFCHGDIIAGYGIGVAVICERFCIVIVPDIKGNFIIVLRRQICQCRKACGSLLFNSW